MLLSAILIGVVFFCLASLVAILLSFAAGLFGPIVGGYVVSTSLVALFTVVVALLLILFRKSLVFDPSTLSRSAPAVGRRGWACAMNEGEPLSATPLLSIRLSHEPAHFLEQVRWRQKRLQLELQKVGREIDEDLRNSPRRRRPASSAMC